MKQFTPNSILLYERNINFHDNNGKQNENSFEAVNYDYWDVYMTNEKVNMGHIEHVSEFLWHKCANWSVHFASRNRN